MTEEEKSLCSKGNFIVRKNLLTNVNYRPYCGNDTKSCYNPRTQLRPDGQFICPNCKLISNFPQEFVDYYKKKHNLE